MFHRYVTFVLNRDGDLSKSDLGYDAVINAAVANYARKLPRKEDTVPSDFGEGAKYMGLREVDGVQYAITETDRSYLEQLEYLKTFQAVS